MDKHDHMCRNRLHMCSIYGFLLLNINIVRSTSLFNAHLSRIIIHYALCMYSTKFFFVPKFPEDGANYNSCC